MRTMKKVTIESDAWSRLKTIRSGVVYDNILTFLYELIQNSQRAKATRIHITTSGSTFQIEDNGRGCEDPKVLFTMDFSGFGVGYGIGFTSVYPIADKVKVETLNWSASLDVERAIREKDLDLDIEENSYINGFRITLESEKIAQYQQDIQDKIREIASIIPNIQIYLNGFEIEKADLFEAPIHTEHHMKTNNRIYEGRLAIAQMSDYGGVEVYYDYRHVCSFYMDGVTGNILIKDNKINLKAPDRKSIIWDDKRRALKEQLEKDIQELCKKIVKESSDEDKERYSDTIDQYLGVEKYIRYLTINESEIKNQYETRETAKETEPVGQMTMDFEEETEEKEQEKYEEAPQEIIQGTSEPKPEINKERRQEDRSFSSFVSAPQPEMISKKNLNQVSLSNIKRKKNVVWVEKKEMDRYSELIAKYEYYGIYTFVSPHVLYDRALRHLAITHISEVEHHAIEKQYSVTKTGARSKKEQRAMELLGFIERKLNLDETFYISDIDCKMIVSLQESKIYQEKLDVEGYAQGSRIHLNRKSLNFGKLSSANLDKDSIGLNDVKFVLGNIVLIAHEISHLYGTKDNTIHHYEVQDSIQEKIGNLFLEHDKLY